MKIILLAAALGLSLAPATELKTKYEAGPGRKVTIESAIHTETSMEVERDGESMAGSGGTSDVERREVHVDHVVEVEEGKPTKVRRHFVDVGGKIAQEAGERSSESELESPWKGVTLELTRDGDDVDARVVAGTEPDGEGVLEGHRLGLFLDAFLPKSAVEPGAEWDLENDAILRGLRLDLQRKLFPPQARPDGEARGGGGGRRGGGRMGGGSETMLAQSDWKGTARLVGTEEKDGALCHVVKIELETSGEREIEARSFGGRRGGMLSPAPENRRSWTVKLEGKLWFDASAKRPMLLELEGSIKEETRTEMEREGATIRMRSLRQGTIDYRVEIEDAPAEAEKPAKKS